MIGLSGIRGSVSLALALIYYNDSRIDSDDSEVSDYCLFYITWMYILDILIKIYPALNFANLLKLDPTSKAKDAILGHVIDIINNSNKDI